MYDVASSQFSLDFIHFFNNALSAVPSDCNVMEDAGIQPRTVAIFELAFLSHKKYIEK
jgi:hypothetical protein